MAMAVFPEFFLCALVALAAGGVNAAASVDGAAKSHQEQVKDEDYGTDVKVSGDSLNMVHWIFIPGLSVVLVVIGCAVFQKCRSVNQSCVDVGQDHVDRVEYKITHGRQAPVEPKATENATAPASRNEADFLQCIEEGMGAVILCGESNTSCREAVELLYRGCVDRFLPECSDSDLSEVQDIREVRSASGVVVPFVVQVPEAHLAILEHRYVSGIMHQPGQLAFVRLSTCKIAAQAASSPVPVVSPDSLQQEGDIEFSKDNDDRV